MLSAICNLHNDGLWMDESRVLWCAQEKGPSVQVGRQSEGRQYMFALSCGRHHTLCTPNALHCADQLLCCWCDPAAHAAAGRQPTAPERDAHNSFELACITELWVREARVPWWRGALDLWFPGPAVAVQIDGPHHFALQSRTPPARQVATKDCNMCAAAWAAGTGLVRVHHLQAGTPAGVDALRLALRARAARPAAPVLVLTAGFAHNPAFPVLGQRDAGAFLAALQGALQTPPAQLPCGLIMFWPPTS